MENLTLNCDNMKRTFLIKRKGINYYTDYIELYLHRTFEDKGYYLVKEASKCVFDVIVDISETEKYMTVSSSYFDDFSDADAETFRKMLSDNFKSEVICVPYVDKLKLNGTPYRFMFSDTYNAYKEDAYVYNGKPEFVRNCFSMCKSNQPFLAEYINYGGAFKGLDIEVLFDGEDVEIDAATLIYHRDKDRISETIFFKKTKSVFKCRIDGFAMERGINKYSAALIGKKKDDEKYRHGFCIRFIPKSDAEFLIPEIKVECCSF